MSLTMIISSKSAPGTTVTSGVGSLPTPAKISSYMSATRPGVSLTPGRSGSSPMPSRISRTACSIFVRSTVAIAALADLTRAGVIVRRADRPAGDGQAGTPDRLIALGTLGDVGQDP